MSLLIELAPEVETRLEKEASKQGVTKSDYAQRLIQSGLPGLTEQQKEQIAFLRALREDGDAEDQRETLEILKKGLNESHPDRLLFP